MSKPKYDWFKVGFGGSVAWNGRVWTAWPWRRWVRVQIDDGQPQEQK